MIYINNSNYFNKYFQFLNILKNTRIGKLLLKLLINFLNIQ